MKTYTKSNFHKHTFCIWQEVPFDNIAGLKESHSSKSGSAYIFQEHGIYRISNHWGRVANCRWRLLTSGNYKNQQLKVGFALWSDFYPNDETSKLFFIKVILETNDVSFFHKLSAEYEVKYNIMNASETSKKIKIIREVLLETSWSKHLKFNNLSALRSQIVEKLLYTDKTFTEIKKAYL